MRAKIRGYAPFDVISGGCCANNASVVLLHSILVEPSLHCSAAFITAFKDTTVLDRSTATQLASTKSELTNE